MKEKEQSRTEEKKGDRFCFYEMCFFVNTSKCLSCLLSSLHTHTSYHICMFMYMPTCIHIHMCYIHTWIICLCIYIHMCCIHAWIVCLCIHIHMCYIHAWIICLCIHIYIHTHTLMDDMVMHTHIHTWMVVFYCNLFYVIHWSPFVGMWEKYSEIIIIHEIYCS